MQSEIMILNELLNDNRLSEAQSLAQKKLIKYPEDKNLKEVYGLILNRSGATKKALELITPLYAASNPSSSIYGLMGRIHKNIWKNSRDKKQAEKSAKVYEEGFNKYKSPYLGINAASMYLVCSNKELCASIAKEVVNICLKEEPTYWNAVTLSEAFILLENFDNSVHYAKSAINEHSSNIGNINSTFQQIKMLKRYIKVPNELIDLFSPPGIVAFSSQMINNQSESIFPKKIESEIKNRITKELEAINAQIGYSSAACGSDILFIETMLERNSEIHIILPFAKDDFIKTSVEFGGKEWLNRFEYVLEKASSVHYATEQSYFGEEHLFEYAENLIQGQSLLKADLFQTQPYFLGVFSEEASDQKTKGSRHFLNQFSSHENAIIIETTKLINSLEIKKTNKSNANFTHNDFPAGMIRDVKSILFADVVGFSKMEEQQKPYFLNEFMNMLNQGIQNLGFTPEVLNTWGDAIFFVGKNNKQAADFAFMLNDMVLNTNWEEKNLPNNLNIRIALHSGPIFIGNDPVLKRPNAYGEHVNRTARMEPITIPGQVYASDQFAANLKLETQNQYKYEFVGNLKLPKAFGDQELYHLNKKAVIN